MRADPSFPRRFLWLGVVTSPPWHLWIARIMLQGVEDGAHAT